jgi:hypothetical protein
MESQIVGFSLIIQVAIFALIILATMYLFKITRKILIKKSNSEKTNLEKEFLGV